MTTTTNVRNTPAGETCIIQVTENLSIDMFRSNKYTGPRDGLQGFMPSRICKGVIVVWSYQKEPHKFGELFECSIDGYVIVIRDRSTVFDVVRVLDFENAVNIKLAGKTITIGGSSTEKLLDIKILIANALKLDVWTSPEESLILQNRSAAKREALQNELAAKEAVKAEARAAREKFITSILARNKVEAFASDGRMMYGIPVTADSEWECLPGGTFCMMMVDDKPVEAFIVKKNRNNGRTLKDRSTEVSTEMPKQQRSTAQHEEIPEALDMVNVTIGNETRPVLIFTDMQDVKTLQKSGLNSGTWIGIQASDILTVYAVYSNDIKAVKQMKKVQPSMAVN